MAKILVVEDEGIVAKNIENSLKKLGYTVPAVVSSGEEAIWKAEEVQPDLVLMDIVLKGDMDGVEAAGQIYSRFNIPVVYLTAYSDDGTLERAKMTEPFGYILKPFEIKEIRSAIEIALHKHRSEKKLKEEKNWFAKTLKNITDAVIITDGVGSVVFVNPNAESLTGWKRKDALGKDLTEVFNVINRRTVNLTGSLLKKVFKGDAVVGLSNHTVLVSRDAAKTHVDVNAVPLEDDRGKIIGAVLVFRRITGPKRVGAKTLRTSEFESSAKSVEEDVSISLILATSSALVREGARKMLETQKSIKIIAEALDRSEIIPLVEQRKPDVLLIDTVLPKLDIQEIIRSIRRKNAKTKVILLLRTLDEKFIINAMSLGVRGYLKDVSDREQFIQAIRTVRKNKVWAEIEIIAKILPRLKPSKEGKLKFLKSDLTEREEDITELVAKGYSNKKISKKLFISEKTVKAHLRNIFKKLGVRSRFQLTAALHNASAL